MSGTESLRQRSPPKVNGLVVGEHKLDLEDPSRDRERESVVYGDGLGWFCHFIFLCGWIFDQTDLVPSWLIRGLVLVGLGALLVELVRFRRWADETRYLKQFFWCFAAMAVELAIENFLVWVVSALDKNKYVKTPGLQDNVELLFIGLCRKLPLLKGIVRFHWAHIIHFLGAVLALPFSVLWEQVPYSGFGMMSRVVLTICISRTIRVICFFVTILPSPKPGCYMRRFPKVPDNVWDFLKIGFREMKGRGGCNDLIFSGHCGIWVIAPLAFHSYYKSKACWVMWLALAQTCIRTVLEHQHYSVDMVLAIIIVAFVWRELDWMYPSSKPLRQRPADAPPDKVHPGIIGFVVAVVALVAYVVIKSGS